MQEILRYRYEKEEIPWFVKEILISKKCSIFLKTYIEEHKEDTVLYYDRDNWYPIIDKVNIKVEHALKVLAEISNGIIQAEGYFIPPWFYKLGPQNVYINSDSDEVKCVFVPNSNIRDTSDERMSSSESSIYYSVKDIGIFLIERSDNFGKKYIEKAMELLKLRPYGIEAAINSIYKLCREIKPGEYDSDVSRKVEAFFND